MGKEEYPIKHGDHLVVRRDFYDHHGIYVGDGKVIHFTGQDKRSANVRMNSLPDFIGKSRLSVRKYKGDTLRRRETVKRAEELLRKGRDGYHYATNNCEHLAALCKTGAAASTQVEEISEVLRFATISPSAAVWRVEAMRQYEDIKIRTYVLRD